MSPFIRHRLSLLKKQGISCAFFVKPFFHPFSAHLKEVLRAKANRKKNLAGNGWAPHKLLECATGK